MSDGGKGSSPRPFSIAQKEYEARWDAIFGRDLKEEEKSLDGVNGSTAVSKTVSEGSNPSRDANKVR